MKRIILLSWMLASSGILLSQDETCSCTDNPWSAFAYMVNEYNETLPPRKEELELGFQFSTSWGDDDDAFEGVVLDDFGIAESTTNYSNDWNFDFDRNEEVRIITQKPDLLSSILDSDRTAFEDGLEINPNVLPESPEATENENIHSEKPKNKEIEKSLSEKEKNSEERQEFIKFFDRKTTPPSIPDEKKESNSVSRGKSYAGSKIKTKSKMKMPRLKKRKKPKKYRGQCPFS